MALPLYVSGKVVKGFGRGGKQLGCPTANFPESVVEAIPNNLPCGVYAGWAKVDRGGPTLKMVMSVGWNPYYQNEKKSMETHILHKFSEDFYGSNLRVAILHYLRPEKDFPSLDALIAAINQDIEDARSALEDPRMKAFKEDPFFADDVIAPNGST